MVEENVKTIIPVDLFLLFRVVNLSNSPASLDQFKIELHMRGDRWLEIHDLQNRDAKIYQGNNVRSLSEIAITPASIGEVFAKPIDAFATERAVALCQIPASELHNVPMGILRFRVTIVDTRGNTDGPVEITNKDVNGAWEFSKLTVPKVGDDLSDFKQERTN